jgi:hypothetical protein
MARTIRFHLDENCHGAIAAGLRRHGVDVSSSPEVGLLRASDADQLAYATSLGRVLFTQDRDFLKLHAAGIPHAGRAVSFSVFAVESGPELQIQDSKIPEKSRNQPSLESGICNLESIPSANVGEETALLTPASPIATRMREVSEKSSGRSCSSGRSMGPRSW